MAEGIDKAEYKRAVRTARRIMGFITVSGSRKVGIKLSKVEALFLVKALADDKPIQAEWGDGDDKTILFVG